MMTGVTEHEQSKIRQCHCICSDVHPFNGFSRQWQHPPAAGAAGAAAPARRVAGLGAAAAAVPPPFRCPPCLRRRPNRSCCLRLQSKPAVGQRCCKTLFVETFLKGSHTQNTCQTKLTHSHNSRGFPDTPVLDMAGRMPAAAAGRGRMSSTRPPKPNATRAHGGRPAGVASAWRTVRGGEPRCRCSHTEVKVWHAIMMRTTSLSRRIHADDVHQQGASVPDCYNAQALLTCPGWRVQDLQEAKAGRAGHLVLLVLRRRRSGVRSEGRRRRARRIQATRYKEATLQRNATQGTCASP